MQKPLRVFAGLALALVAASPLAAQVRKNAFTPFVGYIAPMGELVDGDFIMIEQTGGVQVGITGEFGLSKAFGLSVFGMSTLGLSQSLDITAQDGSDQLTYGAATTQFGATLVFRPFGTLPNGGPKTLYLEAGGAMNLISVADVQSRSGGDPLSLNGSYPMVVLGGGFSFKVGPRTTGLIFARYNLAMSEYSSDWLDDWNSFDPIDSDLGLKSHSLLVGIGIRTGF